MLSFPLRMSSQGTQGRVKFYKDSTGKAFSTREIFSCDNFHFTVWTRKIDGILCDKYVPKKWHSSICVTKKLHIRLFEKMAFQNLCGIKKNSASQALSSCLSIRHPLFNLLAFHIKIAHVDVGSTHVKISQLVDKLLA